MNEKICRIEKADSLNNVIAKLYVIEDFIQRIGDESYNLYEQTPNGLCLIMSDCINALKTRRFA